MIKLGKVQNLIIKRFTSVGAYLNEEGANEGDILLPKAQIPKEAKVGHSLEVFVYNDSNDRIIATTNKSKIQVGEMGHLMVVSTTKIGAFLDWGLEKDLFLPFSEQIGGVEKGKEYLVAAYIDKSNRICATMKIKNMLSTNSPYKESDKTTGTIYSIHREIGAFVAVDDKYDGLIPKRELHGAHEVGEKIEVRVTKVQEDGKLNLSLRDKAYIQMDKDVETILSKLKIKGRTLMLNDDSSPEAIRRELHMSKAAFKRAVGRLLKARIIEFIDNGIKLK